MALTGFDSDQPFKETKTFLNEPIIREMHACRNQRLGKPSIVVSEPVLGPRPVRVVTGEDPFGSSQKQLAGQWMSGRGLVDLPGTLHRKGLCPRRSRFA